MRCFRIYRDEERRPPLNKDREMFFQYLRINNVI